MIAIVLGLIIATIVATIVYFRLASEVEAKRALAEAGDLEAIMRSVDPGTGAGLCWLFPLFTPVVLYRARGWRGALEGVAILVLAWAATVALVIVLVALRSL